MVACATLARDAAHFTVLVAYSLATLGRENYVHEAVHTRGHFLQRYAWFRHIRAMHREHHRRPSTNLGFCDPVHDAVLGTLSLVDEV